LHEVSEICWSVGVTSESAHDRGPFQEPHQIAADIAQGLRASGIACETLILAPAEAGVLRRDRIVSIDVDQKSAVDCGEPCEAATLKKQQAHRVQHGGLFVADEWPSNYYCFVG